MLKDVIRKMRVLSRLALIERTLVTQEQELESIQSTLAPVVAALPTLAGIATDIQNLNAQIAALQAQQASGVVQQGVLDNVAAQSQQIATAMAAFVTSVTPPAPPAPPAPPVTPPAAPAA